MIEKNVGWLRGWVRARVRDPEAVEDVCQDAVLKALRSKGALRCAESFSSWLYRIAANTLRDHLRAAARRKRRISFAEDLDERAAPGDGTETLARSEEAERLLAAVRALPARYREPLLLRHSHDLSYREIGKILGISENAVQVRIFRARRMLRARLGEDGEDRPGGRGEGEG
ncbi:MAG: RNA polymerase sigma factor [Planctomycetota bacterium]